MPCGLCRQPGHYRSTCPNRQTASGAEASQPPVPAPIAAGPPLPPEPAGIPTLQPSAAAPNLAHAGGTQAGMPGPYHPAYPTGLVPAGGHYPYGASSAVPMIPSTAAAYAPHAIAPRPPMVDLTMAPTSGPSDAHASTATATTATGGRVRGSRGTKRRKLPGSFAPAPGTEVVVLDDDKKAPSSQSTPAQKKPTKAAKPAKESRLRPWRKTASQACPFSLSLASVIPTVGSFLSFLASGWVLEFAGGYLSTYLHDPHSSLLVEPKSRLSDAVYGAASAYTLFSLNFPIQDTRARIGRALQQRMFLGMRVLVLVLCVIWYVCT